jgi:hypothetical protein
VTNPFSWFLNWIANAGFSGLWAAANLILRAVVFRPVTLSAGGLGVVRWSAALAESCWALALVLAAVALVWPALQGYLPRVGWGGLLWRAAATGVLMPLGPVGLGVLLSANNQIVAAVAAAVPTTVPIHVGLSVATLSPLLLAVEAVVLAGVVLLLGLEWALRVIELYWRLSLWPWFLLAWLVSGQPGPMWAQVRSLVAAVFQQAGQVLTWWVAARLAQAGGGLTAALTGFAGLLFMVRVPDLMRRVSDSPAPFRGMPW